MGWVSQLMSWIGSGHTKWTHEQLWIAFQTFALTPHLSRGHAMTLLVFPHTSPVEYI